MEKRTRLYEEDYLGDISRDPSNLVLYENYKEHIRGRIKEWEKDSNAFDLYDFEEWHRTQFAASKISFEFALAMSNNDDEKAFELWTEWYTEFKKIANKGAAE